jgi:hypothetical protein
MAEYINRDEFIKSQCHSCDGYCDVIECDCLNCKHECRCNTIADLLDYPAADVVERKHGKWINKYPLSTCSVCEQTMILHDYANFCPNCGADNREENDDG